MLGRGIFVYVFVYLCAYVYFLVGFRSIGGWDFLVLRKMCLKINPDHFQLNGCDK